VIPIDELIEIWIRVHKEVLATYAHDDDLSWWREACQCLRPTDESSVQDAPGSSS
jgi:hypothetical protein